MDLTEEEDRDLDVIFSGMVSPLGRDLSPDNLNNLARIVEMEPGQAMYSIFKRLEGRVKATANPS